MTQELLRNAELQPLAEDLLNQNLNSHSIPGNSGDCNICDALAQRRFHISCLPWLTLALQLEDWLIEVCSLFLPVLTYAYRVNDWLQVFMSFLMWFCAISFLLWCRILADLVFPIDYHECFMPSLRLSFPFLIMSKSIYTSPHCGDSHVIMYINWIRSRASRQLILNGTNMSWHYPGDILWVRSLSYLRIFILLSGYRGPSR